MFFDGYPKIILIPIVNAKIIDSLPLEPKNWEEQVTYYKILVMLSCSSKNHQTSDSQIKKTCEMVKEDDPNGYENPLSKKVQVLSQSLGSQTLHSESEHHQGVSSQKV